MGGEGQKGKEERMFLRCLERRSQVLLKELFPDLPSAVLESVKFDTPPVNQYGDLYWNAALALASFLKQSPLEIAFRLKEPFANLGDIHQVQVAPPGFINFTLKKEVWHQGLLSILKSGSSFGEKHCRKAETVSVEFLSANPTGPLHVAHARGAVLGDVIARLMERAGHRVVREYYINDAGRQIHELAASTFYLYSQQLGVKCPKPQGFYPGAYLKSVAGELIETYQDKFINNQNWEKPITAFLLHKMMTLIKEDLKTLGIAFDYFVSEASLQAEGKVDAILQELQKRNLTYQGTLPPPKGKRDVNWKPQKRLLFRASQFGDDQDRPLDKPDGQWTYFATDIAYHYDKLSRATKLITILGADHGGYIKRIKAVVNALSKGKTTLTCHTCQLVRLLRDGQALPMSKRQGHFLSLKKILQEVGPDVLRFFLLTRRHDVSMDFDLQEVLKETKDNPVFYVQYAHARACSVRKRMYQRLPSLPSDLNTIAQQVNLNLLDDSVQKLYQQLIFFPHVLEQATKNLEPHRLTTYLYELASLFHALFTKGKTQQQLRFINPEDPPRSLANLAVVIAVQTIIADGLSLLGVNPPETM